MNYRTRIIHRVIIVIVLFSVAMLAASLFAEVVSTAFASVTSALGR